MCATADTVASWLAAASLALAARRAARRRTLDDGGRDTCRSRSRRGAGTRAAARRSRRPRRRVLVARGSPVRVELAFDAGHGDRRDRRRTRSRPTTHGREVSWAATRGGGLTVHATGPRGWVTYSAASAWSGTKAAGLRRPLTSPQERLPSVPGEDLLPIGYSQVVLEREDGAAADAVFFMGVSAPTPGAPPHRARQRSIGA